MSKEYAMGAGTGSAELAVGDWWEEGGSTFVVLMGGKLSVEKLVCLDCLSNRCCSSAK
jgi:hypothetical protein